MRAVFVDYHLLCTIIRAGSLSLFDVTQLMDVYPWIVDSFLRNCHHFVAAFHASNVADITTGMTWYYGDCESIAGKYFCRMDCELEYMNPFTALREAIRLEYHATTMALLPMAIDMNRDGTAMYMCRCGRDDLLIYALDHGCHVTNTDMCKTGAVELAIHYRHVNILRVLFGPLKPHWNVDLDKERYQNLCWDTVICKNDIEMAKSLMSTELAISPMKAARLGASQIILFMIGY